MGCPRYTTTLSRRLYRKEVPLEVESEVRVQFSLHYLVQFLPGAIFARP